MLQFNIGDGVIARMSKRKNGNMRLPLGKTNLESFVKETGLSNKTLIVPILRHSSRVEIVNNNNEVKYCDGLITDNSEFLLSVTVADCLPLFMFDSRKNVIGLLHVGWKGLIGNIIENAVNLYKNEFGSNLRELRAIIGPGICKNHFEVGKEIASKFKNVRKKGSKTFVDLKLDAKDRLIHSGILVKNVEVHPDCTFCSNEDYFSYRRDKPIYIQTMVCLLTLKNK